MKLNYLAILAILLIGVVFISGCVYEKSPTKAITPTQPSETPETTPKETQSSEEILCTDECMSDDCEGLEFISCEERSDGCKYKINKGKIIGKCNVECISDNDCVGTDKECRSNKCVAEPVELGHARSKPAPINTALTTHFGYSWSQEVDAEITLMGIKRGSSAWSMIKEANMFNDEPEAGKEYLLAKVRFKLIDTSNDESYSISTYKFETVSEDGIVYENPFIVEPEPQLSKDLYPGATHEGWVAFEVDGSDTNPLMVFDKGGDGELWFKLY